MAARCALRASPELDEEEGGDEAEFPEGEPVEEVERGEGAEEAGSAEAERVRSRAGCAILDLPRGGHADGDDDGGEQQHQQAEAVDAEAVVDVRAGIQAWRSGNWSAAGGRVEVGHRARVSAAERRS